MSVCRLTSCVAGKGYLLWSVHSLDKTLSFCPASFYSPRLNLPVTPDISWLHTFAFQFPVMKRTSFLGLVLEDLVGLHRTDQLQLLWHQWSGHRLGLLRCLMFCLRNRKRSLCLFWDCWKILHFGLFCWLWMLLHFFKGILEHSSRYKGHLN